MNIAISPSTLDQYRVCKSGAYGKGDSDMISYITGTFEKNQAMSFGSAYHELIEYGGDKYRVDKASGVFYEVFDKDLGITHSFSQEVAQPALDYRSVMNMSVYEVKGVKLIHEFKGYKIHSFMRLDALRGNMIHEIKTSQAKRMPGYKSFKDSMQWRMYLLAVPDAPMVQYDIFWNNRYESKVQYNTVQFFRSDSIKSEVHEHIEGLVRFAENKNIISHLKMRNQ